MGSVGTLHSRIVCRMHMWLNWSSLWMLQLQHPILKYEMSWVIVNIIYIWRHKIILFLYPYNIAGFIFNTSCKYNSEIIFLIIVHTYC